MYTTYEILEAVIIASSVCSLYGFVVSYIASRYALQYFELLVGMIVIAAMYAITHTLLFEEEEWSNLTIWFLLGAVLIVKYKATAFGRNLGAKHRQSSMEGLIYHPATPLSVLR